jgi:hypothetical protein
MYFSANPAADGEDDNDAEDTDDTQSTHRSMGGFARGLTPEGITSRFKGPQGEILFTMKWVEEHHTEVVQAHVALFRCPGLVFEFYERAVALTDTPHLDTVRSVTPLPVLIVVSLHVFFSTAYFLDITR